MRTSHHFKIIFIIIFITLFGFSVAWTSQNQSAMRIIAEAIENLSHVEFYQALANPSVKYVKIAEGLRKEEIVDTLDNKFPWDVKDTADFLGHDEYRNKKFEGKYYPDVYLIPRNSSGSEIKQMMNERFNTKYNKIKSSMATSTLNTDTILTIASIIQREAAGKSDMNLISGIIWNRLFKGMNLQIDATLQYAKGTEENGWWPKVLSKDKNIDSPYNTYKNKGLPPSAIANPGLAAISAALNPQKTKCLFYLHSNRQIYCSATYEEHKNNIDTYLK
jgi:UPF0755 protein